MIFAVLILTIALAGCGSDVGELPTYNTVPVFQLTDQTGALFDSQAQLAGKIWVADFIFTNCTGPCPRMSSQVHRLQSDLRDLPGVKFVSFTVDPDNDTPQVLARYAGQFGAQPGRWYFLTGARDILHNLNRHTFMLGDVKGNLDHSTRFVLVDGTGSVRGYYLSYESEDIKKLVSDIRRLVESSVASG